jgi:hypothetical protein
MKVSNLEPESCAPPSLAVHKLLGQWRFPSKKILLGLGQAVGSGLLTVKYHLRMVQEQVLKYPAVLLFWVVDVIEGNLFQAWPSFQFGLVLQLWKMLLQPCWSWQFALVTELKVLFLRLLSSQLGLEALQKKLLPQPLVSQFLGPLLSFQHCSQLDLDFEPLKLLLLHLSKNAISQLHY